MLFDGNYSKYMPLASIGLQLGFSVIGASLLGLWLDGKFDTKPWLMMGGLVLGFAAGIRAMLREWKLWKSRYSEDEDEST